MKSNAAETYPDVDPEAEEQDPEERPHWALLRKGYTLQLGSGSRMRTMHGPRKISVDKETARLHLHKFENVDELRKWIGMPPNKYEEPENVQARRRMEEREMHQAVAAQRAVSLAGGKGLDGPAVNRMVDEAITRRMPELADMIADRLRDKKPAATDEAPAAPKPATRTPARTPACRGARAEK